MYHAYIIMCALGEVLMYGHIACRVWVVYGCGWCVGVGLSVSYPRGIL